MLVLSMTNRFSHAQDRVRRLIEEWHKADGAAKERIKSQIRIFEKRLRLLAYAISFGLGSVLLTALLMIILFTNVLVATTFRGLVVAVYALSLLSLVTSLLLFMRDMSLSLSALKSEMQEIR